MGTHKLTDKEKVSRAKASALRALSQRKTNPDRNEVMGQLVSSMCMIFAILDADKNDSQSIQFVATSLWIEVTGQEQVSRIPVSEATQLELGEQIGVLGESGKNTPKKTRK